MGTRDFFSDHSTRRLWAIPLAVALLAAAVAAAVASNARDRESGERPAADTAHAAIAGKLARIAQSRNPIQTARSIIGETPPPTPYDPGDAGDRISNRSLIVAAAVEWPYSYVVVSRKPVSGFGDSDQMSMSLIRRHLVSGERRVLLRIRKSIFTALKAGGGRVYVGLVALRGGNRMSSSVLGGAHDAARLTTVDNASLKAGSESLFGGFCGGVTMLDGTLPTGEAVVARTSSICTVGGGDRYGADLVAIDAGGNDRVIDPRPNVSTLLFGRVEASGTHFVQSGAYGGIIDATELDTGEERRLWIGSQSTSASIAADGSVVVGPAVGLEDDGYPGEPVNVAKPTTNPFVIFPQGDVESPSPLADAGYQSVAMRYCGSQLYELRSSRIPRYDETVAEIGIYGGVAVISDFEVWARDLAGASPRRLGTTGRVWIRDFTCDGETLVLATDQRVRVAGQRFGP